MARMRAVNQQGKNIMPLPTDPLLASQWHLRNNTPGLLDLNVLGVWNPSEGPAYTGAGTRTVVIDDGFDYTHSDLAANYDQTLDFDFEFNTLDPFGAASDAHGTAVSGIIGADNNGTGAVGVAYDTSLVGYRTAGLISDAWLQDIRDAISFAATNALGDVANISQGIANDAASEFGVGYNAVRFDEIETSIGTAVNTGRGGLGMSIVKSAGNSRGDNYDVNADDWTNDTRQVVVGAVDQDGFVSSYSSYGAALLVSAFGTPGEVVTTDRVGAAGYNGSDFTYGFNGTSSAAPMVTGVISLMYDANGALGWRDVQSILASSARQVGSEVGAGIAGSERYAWNFNAAGTWNGGGMHFSNDYGYGLVDALAAVRLAETWLLGNSTAQTTSNEFTNTMDVLNASTVIPDGNATGLSFTGNAIFDDTVDRVTVQMTLNTTFTGDLEVYLTSPDGTVSLLIADTGGGNDFNGTWTFESQAFRGERAAGNWTVRVVDDAGGDALTVSDIVIRTFGSATTNDRYVYTNEYSDYAGTFSHFTNVSDSNGGNDTVNASAVSSSSTINLDGSVSTIDGVGVTFANIENAIGGDASDNINGDGSDNLLYGMRGNDIINGGGGVDTLYGGWGNDTLDGGLFKDNCYGEEGDDTFRVTGADYGDNVYGGSGIDRLDLSGWTNSSIAFDINLATQNYQFLPNGFGLDGTYDAQSIENVTGSNYNDTITGDDQNNTLDGWGGNDIIYGGGGVDLLFGYEGDDILNGGLFEDTCYGENGNDTFQITGADYADNVYGGNGTDTLDLSGWTNSSIAFNVNLLAQSYEFLPNSFGQDGIYVANSIETVIGSNYDDTITGDALANRLYGGDGIDTLDGGALDDRLYGGNGSDNIFGGSGADTLFGGAGADVLNGGTGSDFASYYYDGAVNISLDGSVVATGAAAGDVLISIANLSGSNTGGDVLSGNSSANILNGNGGDDSLRGRGGADVLNGGSGSDFASYYYDSAVTMSLDGSVAGTGAAAGDTFISIENISGSNTGNDNLTGNAGANKINGNGGNDTLFGLDGNDTLRGGTGVDTLSGGVGADTFEYRAAAEGGDFITSFSSIDFFAFTGSAFGGLAAGVLNGAFFQSRAGDNLAQDINDRFIFNEASDTLWYDSTGSVNGAADAIMIADITSNAIVTAGDIMII
jgi:Ca2+-binding RTX toxin-like protein/subtilisin-like proprotein convertase family protein